MTLRHLQLPPDSARHREHGDDDDLAGNPWAAPLGDPGGSWSPSAAVSPVSALSLQRQSETSNVFLEFLVVSQGGELELPDQPRPGAAVHRTRSGRAVTRRPGQPGHPERGAHGIVTDLAAADYAVTQKRRPPQPLPDPGVPPATRTRQPGTRHRRRPGPPSRRRRETAADRYGTSLRTPVAGA